MISKINSYLFRQVLIAFLFSGLAVSFVVLFTQSFRMLSFVIDNSSTLVVFGQLMGLMIPAFLPLILPISVGVAVLFIYHKFAVDSELVVMRAAGISSLKLALPGIMLALLVVAVGLFMTFWVTPRANGTIISLQETVRDDYSAHMIQPGVFNDLAQGLTLYARRRGAGGGLEDILVHDVRSPRKPITIMAKNGVFSVESGIPQIVVFQGRRQEVDVATGRLQELRFDRYTLDLHALKKSSKQREIEPREMTLSQLLQTQHNPAEGKKRQSKARTELHQRLAAPLLALTFAMIGVTVILAGDFNRRGMSQRVLFSALSIIALQAAMFGLVSQVNKSGWYVILLYLIIILPVWASFRVLSVERFLTFSWKKDQPKEAPHA